MTETVAAPVISPADGSELSEGNNTVTIGCDTEGATVYYTIDGSVPTVGVRYVFRSFPAYIVRNSEGYGSERWDE